MDAAFLDKNATNRAQKGCQSASMNAKYCQENLAQEAGDTMMLVSKVALRHMIAIQVPLVLCSKRLAIKLMLFVCPESIEAEKRTNR